MKKEQIKEGFSEDIRGGAMGALLVRKQRLQEFC